MNIEIRYQSRGGNTKAVAELIAQQFNIKAMSVENKINEYTDILIVGGGVYQWTIDDTLKVFLEALDSNMVGQIFMFSTTGYMDTALKKIKEIAENKNIKVNDNFLLLKMFFKGHASLGMKGGKLSHKHEVKIKEFTEKIKITLAYNK